MTDSPVKWRLVVCWLALLMLNIGSMGQPLHAAPLVVQTPASNADWPSWGYDLANHRYNAGETAITPATVAGLRPLWTFAFPNTMIASSEPVIIGDTVYIGSWNGAVYALDAATGRQRWMFSTNITGKIGSVRNAVVVTHNLVIFGDQLGRVFALNQPNGTLAWIQQTVSDHPLAQITGALVAYGDRVYVPMASREEDAASNPAYACCTFRGSLTALNVADGAIAWRFYTVDPPQPLNGTLNALHSGPSGAGIWSTPAIDPDAGLIYITTGNSYSPPVSPYSDAILAISLADGHLRWSTQLTADDWANNACRATPNPNCAGEHGRDLDFGSAPILFSVNNDQGVQKWVAAIQKNGVIHALDALTGKIVWTQQVGRETSYAWGLSYDGSLLYMADTTYEVNGGVYALDPMNGYVAWHIGAMPCTPVRDQQAARCWSGYMAAASSTPGIVWLGTMDGQLRALDANGGAILWTYNTTTPINSINGVMGHGGSIGPTNAVIANGRVFVTSGYAQWTDRLSDGNILMVFGLPSDSDYF